MISLPSNLNFSCFSLNKRTFGVAVTSTPRYSASLSKSPCPSFLVESVRIRLSGEVASNYFKASKAELSALSSPRKRNKAELFCWNIFSMAALSKGRTSADTRRTMSNRMINFMDIKFI